MFCPLVFLKVSSGKGLQGLVFGNSNKKYIKQSILLGVSTFAFIFIAYFLLRPLLSSDMIIGALSNIGIDRENFVFVFVYVIFVNAALEELFFRGFVFLNLYRRGHKRYAHLLSSLLFALYHVSIIRSGAVPGVLLFGTAGLFVTGLFFNELARRTDGAIGSYAVHASANLAINIIGLYYMYHQ